MSASDGNRGGDGRRSLLKVATGGLFAGLGAAVAAPIAAFLAGPTRRSAEPPHAAIPVGELARLPEGQPVQAAVIAPSLRDAWTRFSDVALGAVWLVRHGNRVAAFSTACPHAGCFVDFDPKKGCFACPCHGSAFALDGTRTAGPSPRPLDTLEAEVKDGRVHVRFQRFRPATSGKEPA